MNSNLSTLANKQTFPSWGREKREKTLTHCRKFVVTFPDFHHLIRPTKCVCYYENLRMDG